MKEERKPIVMITSTETDESLLRNLKKEILRLGLEDNPSKTEFNKRYNRENSASPTKLLSRFECTWAELMGKIGIEYDGEAIRAERASEANKGKQHAGVWIKMDREDVMDIVIEEMRNKGIWTSPEYIALRDRKESPSLPVVNKVLGSWKTVKNEYEIRYGKMR